MPNTAMLIERLLQFGVQHSLITTLDAYAARNTLLDLFGLAQPWEGEVPPEVPDTPTVLLEGLLDAAARAGLFDNDVPALRVNFEARIMGALMPRPSEVSARFWALYHNEGPQAATGYFYKLCIASNYIRTAQIARNIQWQYAGKYGALEITINLTKPEKDPKTIALERLQPAASYPKCMLCIENMGYAGRINFPARQNHRAVPVTLCGQPWYLQYSPYVYYNEHCIVFSATHEPMTICDETFAQLFSFVEQFPHYTCGSNADLPIVGGSILSHMHFQGGCYAFPMQSAAPLRAYRCPQQPDITLHTLRWPVSTLRACSHDARALIRFGAHFLHTWRNYSDAAADILAFTEEGGHTTPHNTVTPILHYNQALGYVLDLVPRNNRTTGEHPEGIFHPHREIHHIKKENIGLIEVMGLAILPSRLKDECAAVERVLTGAVPVQEAQAALPAHALWIDQLVRTHGTGLSKSDAQAAVRHAVGEKFETCLEQAGVFKQNEAGLAAWDRFMHALGCEPAAEHNHA